MKTKRIPLAKLRYENKTFVAKLQGMKSILRIATKRTVKWFLVLPAVGDGDAVCVPIKTIKMSEGLTLWREVQKRIIAEYADRIIA